MSTDIITAEILQSKGIKESSLSLFNERNPNGLNINVYEHFINPLHIKEEDLLSQSLIDLDNAYITRFIWTNFKLPQDFQIKYIKSNLNNRYGQCLEYGFLSETSQLYLIENYKPFPENLCKSINTSEKVMLKLIEKIKQNGHWFIYLTELLQNPTISTRVRGLIYDTIKEFGSIYDNHQKYVNNNGKVIKCKNF